jgi:GTP-binding protein HflX
MSSNWNPNKQGKFRNSIAEETPKRLSPQERNTFSTDVVPEKALLLSVCPSGQTMERTEEYLAELAFLLETAGGVAVKQVVQKLDRPDSRTYVGSGKLEEIKEYCRALEVDFVVVDDELSPAQLRNLEKELECRILDRTTLILDIFAKRARTSTARTQVELAQLQYMLPRLTRMWTHLERQRGGIGMRGPGETQIETDRRLIKEKISLLREQLGKIDKQKTLQRKNRESLVRVALVGYTNVGKSTLMNVLSKSEVFAENKLFATLDTTVRKVVIENLPFLLTDTVGFIRKLPTQLVESFKSTLDEVVEADLLLHVVDVSHPDHEEQVAAVVKTLGEIGAADKPVIMVYNKIDRMAEPAPTPHPHPEEGMRDDTPLRPLHGEGIRDDRPLRPLPGEGMRGGGSGAGTVFVSAATRQGIDVLRQLLYDEVSRIHAVRYPYNNFLF